MRQQLHDTTANNKKPVIPHFFFSCSLLAAHTEKATMEDTQKKVTFNAGSIKRRHNRILVTGGCGFIGSHLIDRLMQDPHNHIICVDNCFSGNKDNIKQWLNEPRFEFMRHDVRSR